MKRRVLCAILAVLMVLTTVACADPGRKLKNDLVSTASNYNAKPVFTQAVIDEAIDAFEACYWPSPFNRGEVEKTAGAMYYLTVLSRLSPESKHSETGETVVDAAVRHIENVMTGGNEPRVAAGPYWAHALVSATMTLAQETPAVYKKLSAGCRERMDWYMRAVAITGNWAYNARNHYSTSYDCGGNFFPEGPNYKNTVLGGMVSAGMYFRAQGIDLDEIFAEFDYDVYMAKFEELGLTNIMHSFAASTKELMENGGEALQTLYITDGTDYNAGLSLGTGVGVKAPFAYAQVVNSYDVYHFLEDGDLLYLHTVEDFQKIVSCLICDSFAHKVVDTVGDPASSTYCYMMSPGSSPVLGRLGMMTELDIQGSRSSLSYCFESLKLILALYTNMKLLGYWNSDTEFQLEMDDRVFVGTEDYFYKLSKGWNGKNQNARATFSPYSLNSMGARIVKDLWSNLHKQGEHIEIEIADNPAYDQILKSVVDAEPSPEGLSENAFASKTMWTPWLSNVTNQYPEDAYYPLDPVNNTKYESADLSFDIVIGDLPSMDYNNFVIGLDAAGKQITYEDTSMQIQLASGKINIRDGSSYVSTYMVYGSNYRFHVDLSFDVSAGRYEVGITQTYPEPGDNKFMVYEQPKLTYTFRAETDHLNYVDSIIPIRAYDQVEYWIDNFTLTNGEESDPSTWVIENEEDEKVFYENNYNNVNTWDTGARAQVAGDNEVLHAFDQNMNGHLDLRYTTAGEKCNFQITTKFVGREDDMYIDLALSTDGSVPTSRVNPRNKSEVLTAFLRIINNELKAGDEQTVIGTLTAGVWTKIRIKYTPIEGKFKVYIFDEATEKYAYKGTYSNTPSNAPISAVSVGTTQSVAVATGDGLFLDDVKIYRPMPSAVPEDEDESEPVLPDTTPDVATEYTEDFETGTLDEIIAGYTYKDRVQFPNTMSVDADASGNKFLNLMLQDKAKTCWLEADPFDLSAAKKVVLDVSLRSTGVAAGTKDSTYTFGFTTAHQLKENGVEAAARVLLFRVNESDSGADVTVLGTKVADLSKTEWTKLRFVVDNESITENGATVYPCVVYVYNSATGQYEKVHEVNLAQPVRAARMTVRQETAKIGFGIYVDDLKIYAGE